MEWRLALYIWILEECARSSWDEVINEIGLLTLNRWPIEKDHSIVRRLLRACVLEENGNWDNFIPLMEFTYNNSFHSIIIMVPCETFFGRKYKTHSVGMTQEIMSYLDPR